jgi:hypothetical protein
MWFVLISHRPKAAGSIGHRLKPPKLWIKINSSSLRKRTGQEGTLRVWINVTFKYSILCIFLHRKNKQWTNDSHNHQHRRLWLEMWFWRDYNPKTIFEISQIRCLRCSLSWDSYDTSLAF